LDTSPPLRQWGRKQDRRRGVRALIAAVVRALPRARDPRHVRERFEEELRQMLNARRVELRDSVAPVRSEDEGVSMPLVMAGLTLGAIDVTFDRRGPLDAWDRHALEAARDLGVLVLVIDRAVRAGLFAAARNRVDGAAPILGSSAAIRALRARIERVAPTDFAVLIEGESGSGKELVARQMHDLSVRRNGPFVAVNCAAIVETLLEAELFGIEERIATGVRARQGKFETAHEGTLFLDEVSDLSPAAQAKLLRVIQEMSVERVGGGGARRVDVRIIAATNQTLAQLVAQGRFRLDLYYRLHGVEIIVPPLRERPEDILELAEYFLERHRSFRRLRLSQGATDALLAYAWPGNVRELQRVMERAVALAESDCLQLTDLPPALLKGYAENLVPSLARDHTMRTWGSRYARLVLERCDNNKRRACRELGISYHTLQGYIRFRPEERHAKRGLLPPAAADGSSLEF
jgi:transcriptional regulator with PAS, ATPase and Fis domain